MAEPDTSPYGLPAIFGLLAGTVLSALTGEWWWVGVGGAAGIAAGLARR